MGYNNNRTSPYQDYYSDGCGSTSSEKYYVNGTFIDLCGLSVEEYMKNNCCNCCGGNNNNNQEGVKPKNNIVVKSFEDENNTIFYQAFSKFPVTSNLKISVYSTSGNITELDLYVGDTQSLPEIGESMEYDKVVMNLTEDENYEYVLVPETKAEDVVVYTATPLASNGDNFSETYTSIVIKMGETSDIQYIIPATDVNYDNFEEDEDYLKFCKENEYCFVLCLPKTIYDNNQYSIVNYSGLDVSGKFNFVKEFTTNNISYVLLKECALTEDEIFEYVPLYQEEHIFEYKLTLNK